MASRNWASRSMYTGHVMPVLIDCNFTVASANGLGVTGLVGPYVQNAFMHTSTTPAAGNSNPATPNVVITNPNPASGTLVIQLQDTYSKLYMHKIACQSPLGTPVKIDNSAMTAGVAYVITTLGTATAAKWLAIGVPAGVTPAVGVSFIAASDGGTGNTLNSRVAPTATAGSGIFTAELVGASLAPAPGSGIGSQIILQFRNDSSADAPAIAAPADGTLVRCMFLLSNSSVLVGGE